MDLGDADVTDTRRMEMGKVKMAPPKEGYQVVFSEEFEPGGRNLAEVYAVEARVVGEVQYDGNVQRTWTADDGQQFPTKQAVLRYFEARDRASHRPLRNGAEYEVDGCLEVHPRKDRIEIQTTRGIVTIHLTYK